MQLNSLIVETRVRSAWAAIDLGFVLGRRFWVRSCLAYMLVAAPVFVVARLAHDIAFWLPFLIVWWCKPLFERPILFILSRELFSQPTSFRQTLGHFKQWLFPGLVWILSLRRLSIGRAMYAPITLLEQPDSNQYGPRASVLGGKFSSEAAWLTVALFHLEQTFWFAVLALLIFLLPEQFDISLAWIGTFDSEYLYYYISALVAYALVAPFYVAAGFMLYISRRVELEGWDIEICFRDWMATYKEVHESDPQEISAVNNA